MSDEAFHLSTTPEILLGLPIDEALTESDKAEVWSYGQVFFAKATQAEASGHAAIATAWRLIGQLSQVRMQESDPGEPFHPIFEGPQGRSILPSDLDDVSAQAVRQFAMAIRDPELRARLLDIIWERLRDPEAARQAAQSYIDAANRLFDPEQWVAYVTRIERAVRLARQLGDQSLLDFALAEIERRVIELDGGDPLFMTVRLMELLHEFRKGDPNVMSRIAAKAARAAHERKTTIASGRIMKTLSAGGGERRMKRASATPESLSLNPMSTKLIFIRAPEASWVPLTVWNRLTRLSAAFRECVIEQRKFMGVCARHSAA